MNERFISQECRKTTVFRGKLSLSNIKKLCKTAVAAILVFSFTACGVKPSVSEKAATSETAAEKNTARKAEKITIERKNSKVSLSLPLEEQLKVIEKENNKWWYNQADINDDEYMEIFAVTDFNQNGYLELLVQQNPKYKAALFEVNENGSGLTECEVSQKVFSYYMDNPLCSYYDEKNDTWHIAEEENEHTDKMKKAYMCFKTETCPDKEDLLTDLEESWENFAVYEALDVSQWEKKLTKDEIRQLRLIANTMNIFGHEDSGKSFAYEHEYAVCDLNQDGKLDLLCRFIIGSGIIRQCYYCYSVDKEGIKSVPDEADRINNPEKYGENGFTSYEMCEKIRCYHDGKSGEIFYVFSAATEYENPKREYKMSWNNSILSIHPLNGEVEKADRKGEASLCWAKRSSMSCSDYQYENVLASYLGWGIEWN